MASLTGNIAYFLLSFFSLSSFPPSSSSLLLHPSFPSISTTYFFLQTNQLIPHFQ